MRGPWNRRKPKEYHTASEWDKVQWACGIPQRFWELKSNHISPAAFQYKNKDKSIQRISASLQQDYLEARLSHPELLLENRIVCITSHPTDEHGLAAASLLASSLIGHRWEKREIIKVRVDDIQDYEQALKLDLNFFPVEPDMLFIHNLSENSSRERLSLARDLLLKMEGTYRGVVASCENPLKFSREVLKIEPHESYHFENRPQKVMTR